MEVVVRPGKVEDVDKLVAFLTEAKLGTEGVEKSIEYFLIIEDEAGDINATLGIEPIGEWGLLRSLVINSNIKEKELLILFEKALQLAKEKNLSTIFLATNKTKSLDFFQYMGFDLIDSSKLPKPLLELGHVEHILSVDNPIFMVISL